MDCPTHKTHKMKCPTNKNDFTVYFHCSNSVPLLWLHIFDTCCCEYKTKSFVHQDLRIKILSAISFPSIFICRSHYLSTYWRGCDLFLYLYQHTVLSVWILIQQNETLLFRIFVFECVKQLRQHPLIIWNTTLHFLYQ